MIRDVLRMGDPRLLAPSRPVEQFATPELDALLADLRDTMAAQNGAGLAAPQIGVGAARRHLRLRVERALSRCRAGAVHRDRQSARHAAHRRRWRTDWEGCLSVPGLRGVVPRFTSVRYEGFDPQGRPIAREATGFHARVVQHECDHLDGILYPMRMRDMRNFGFTEVLFPDAPAGEE